MKNNWIIQLAYRNLLRYGRRTLITAGAIAFGLCFYIWVDSILAGADEESQRNLLRYETSDGALAPAAYIKDRDTAKLSNAFDWKAAADELEAQGAAVAPRVPFAADLVFYKDPFPEDGSVPALITGIHPERDGDVFYLEETLGEGRWLSEGSNGIILGRWLARDIGAVIGAPMMAITETRDGYAQVIDLEVVGILDSPNPEVNRGGAYVSLDLADTYLEMGGGVPVMNIAVPLSLQSSRRNDPMVGIASEQGLEWYPWQVLAADYVAVMETETSGSATIIMLILIIAGVGISNTMLMAVLERRREVGMMRAMGMDDHHIRRLFLWESAGIGLVGSVLGIVIGALVNIPVVRYGLDYSSIMQEVSYGFRNTGVFYGSWHLQGYLISLALGVGLSVLVAAASIRRILRIGIVDSLRFD